MQTAPPPNDPLTAIFSGKRDNPRVATGRGVRATGGGGTFYGRTLDLSQSGAHFVVDEANFYEDGLHGLDLVTRAFPEGLEIAFPAEAIEIPASVVRITPYDGGRVAVGCRFERPLLGSEIILLGLGGTGLDHPEALMATLPYLARPSEPVSLLVFAGDNDAGGPRSLGRVTAVGARVVEAVVLAPTMPAGGLVEDLLAQPLTAALVRGVHRLWRGAAVPFDCRVLAEELGPTLRLLTDEALPRAVHRRFRAV